jgi:hypothetical protein
MSFYKRQINKKCYFKKFPDVGSLGNFLIIYKFWNTPEIRIHKSEIQKALSSKCSPKILVFFKCK